MRKAQVSMILALIAVAAATGPAYAGAAPVPAPGSLAMLVSGIVGLAGAAWWFRRK